eukprot:7933373-Pyramimonas_sp.AAC.1
MGIKSIDIYDKTHFTKRVTNIEMYGPSQSKQIVVHTDWRFQPSRHAPGHIIGQCIDLLVR